MSEFHLSNRTQAEAYRKSLDAAMAHSLEPVRETAPKGADPQKLYLDFKNRIEKVIAEETASLEKALQSSDNSHLLLLKRTALVDAVVDAAYTRAIDIYNLRTGRNLTAADIPVAIVARGGYGREEMYLRSDVDLEIVTTSGKSPHSATAEIVKHFEYLVVFQDLFSAPASSCHSEPGSLDQDLSQDNFDKFFSLLENRFVAGNPMVYVEFKGSLKTARLIQRENILKHCFRHKTYYDVQNTVFQQEPNVKEEMRRLYWALALVRIRRDFETSNQFELLDELYTQGILSPPAFKNMKNALNFLSRVRMLLHSLQKGAHRDVLGFEVRDEIARRMGYDLKTLYEQYFYHAGYPLKRYSRNLFWESMTADTRKVKNLSEFFALNAERQIIFDKNPERLFAEKPQWIYRILSWVAEKNYFLSYPVIRSIENQVDQMEPMFLDPLVQEEIRENFKKIIRGKYFSKALRLLHEFGLLGGYNIPEFKNICGLLQDIYVHKFPTDMHILSALDALNSLEIDPEADTFLAGLYQSVRDKTTLKLSVVMHDLGKGAKKDDQNEELVGARMVPGIMQQLGYSGKPKRVADVAFLVEKHLTIYDLMLLDPEEDDTYDMVWDLVNQDSERLKMLVLLTFADRAGTKMKMSPSQIQQLKMFYQYTLYHKRHTQVPSSIKREFMQMVRLPHDMQTQLEVYYDFARSPDRFATELVFKPDNPSDLIVCAKDTHGLLFRISIALAYNRLNIVEANIQTWRDTAFDVFRVLDSSGNPIEHSNFFFAQKQIIDDLHRIFVDRKPPAEVFRGRTLIIPSKQAEHKEVKLKVNIIGRSVKLSTHDLFGTFMVETRVFSEYNLEIQRAVLHSHQGTASNIFYIRPEDVEPFIQKQSQFTRTLKEALGKLLQPSPNLLDEVMEAPR
ncbi:MAG: hypothetical protein JSU88_09090 [Nitrospinaceae bacterium]|jgi:UTP:GlnB (protein PII) uridylyltransferase|nr:MAG: hypothetical protein JSU88_09090 [Nitrospinaceae bacterium]